MRNQQFVRTVLRKSCLIIQKSVLSSKPKSKRKIMQLKTIEQLLRLLPKNKTIESTIPNLFFYCADRPSKTVSYIQEPSICIVLQGEREIYLGKDCQKFDNSSLMFCPVDIPLSMHIKHA